MMLSIAALKRLAGRENIALGALEKDYVITEVLKALSQVPLLNELLVFKGGTALRKTYFFNWRYSEDLDFTAKYNIAQDELLQSFSKWYDLVERTSQIQLTTKQLHKPNGYANVRIQFLGPLAYPSMIYMDLVFDEPICLKPEHRKVLTYPFTNGQQLIQVYPLEELFAEKLRSLLERGKSRDYYDVWRILKDHQSLLDFKLMGEVFTSKLKHKGLFLSSVSHFLPNDPKEISQYWEKDLQQQVNPLPSFEEILHELEYLLEKFVAPYILLST